MTRLLALVFFVGSQFAVCAQRTATLAKDIRLPEGFVAELLYSVPRETQGSWVAMCRDD